MNFSFKDYFMNLSNTLVADKMLNIIHLICQISVIWFLFLLFLREMWWYFMDISDWILILICIPVYSILIRLVFEFIGSIFAIKRNSDIIANSFEWMLDCDCWECCEECCDDCDCECWKCECCHECEHKEKQPKKNK